MGRQNFGEPDSFARLLNRTQPPKTGIQFVRLDKLVFRRGLGDETMSGSLNCLVSKMPQGIFHSDDRQKCPLPPTNAQSKEHSFQVSLFGSAKH